MTDDVTEKPITLELILKSSGLKKDATISLEDRLLKLKRIWLNEMAISMIDNLEMLGNITHLYLDNNSISIIQNLETVGTSLQHLSLKGNHITDVGDGLICLDKLMSLDVSNNKIASLRIRELPPNISFLDISDNPVMETLDQASLIQTLHKLKVFNKELLEEEEDSEEDEDEEGDEEEEKEEEKEVGEEAEPGCFQDITRHLRESSVARQNLMLEHHQQRIHTLSIIKDEMSTRKEENCRISKDYTIEGNSSRADGLLRGNSNISLPTLEHRPLSSQSLTGRKPSLLDPLPGKKPLTPSKKERVSSPKHPRSVPRINSPKRLGAERVDITLRQPLEAALVKTDELDKYLTDVNNMFKDIRGTMDGL